MSKKMMKRTAALSALIAISLSGTVFAAEVTYDGQNLTGPKTYGVDIDLKADGNLADNSTVVTDCTTEKNSAISINGLSVNLYQHDAVISNTKLTVSGSTLEGILTGVDVSEYSAGSSEVENHVTVDNTEVKITDSTTSRNIYGVDASSYGKMTADITNTKLTIEDSDVKSAYIAGVSAYNAGMNVSDVEVVMKNNNIQVPANSYPANASIYSVIVSAEDTTVKDTSLTVEGGTVNANVYAIRMSDAGASTAVAENNTVNVIGTEENPLTMTGNVYGVAKANGKITDIGSNNKINVSLAGEESSLTGDVFGCASGSTEATVTVSDDAAWNVTKDSYVNDLILNDGNVALVNEVGQTVTVENLGGSGGTIETASLDNQMVVGTSTIGELTVKGDQSLMAAFENSTTGDLEDLMTDLAGIAVDGNGDTVATQVTVEGNALYGDTTASLQNGQITNIVTQENKANAGLIDMTALSFMAWRGENDDLNERLGNLRDAREDRGIWTRMARAQQSYNSVSNQYSMYQIGYDQQAGDWTIGAAYSYTDGKSWFAEGTGENTHNVVSLYGMKMNDNGTFVDLVAKYGNLDYDYTLQGGVGNGDYDTDAYSFSAEVGKRITSTNGAWVEPQFQLTYGTVDSASFTTANRMNVHIDSADSFVARAGIVAGKPVHKGNIYLKASYLYDFDGEVDGTFSNGTRSVDISRDLGGGWWEVGFGANFDLSDATHLYLDFEKAIAGEVDVEWKWNAGVRYSF